MFTQKQSLISTYSWWSLCGLLLWWSLYGLLLCWSLCGLLLQMDLVQLEQSHLTMLLLFKVTESIHNLFLRDSPALGFLFFWFSRFLIASDQGGNCSAKEVLRWSSAAPPSK